MKKIQGRKTVPATYNLDLNLVCGAPQHTGCQLWPVCAQHAADAARLHSSVWKAVLTHK